MATAFTYTDTRGDLRRVLRNVLNMYSVENVSNTSDHILALYLMDSLEAFERAVKARDLWWTPKGVNNEIRSNAPD